MSYDSVVVDLETLDTANTAIILSIGAVAFNHYDEDDWDSIIEERCFYRVLELDTQRAADLTESESTVNWWAKQSVAAKQAFDVPKIDTKTALEEFNTFCAGTKVLWGNGNMFDNAILRNACAQLSTPYPYEFWEDVDMRTLMFLAGGNNSRIKFQGTPHNALDDAKHEVLLIQDAYNNRL